MPQVMGSAVTAFINKLPEHLRQVYPYIGTVREGDVYTVYFGNPPLYQDGTTMTRTVVLPASMWLRDAGLAKICLELP